MNTKLNEVSAFQPALTVEQNLSEKARQLVYMRGAGPEQRAMRSLCGVVQTTYPATLANKDAHREETEAACESIAKIVNILVDNGYLTGIVATALVPLARITPSVSTAILVVVVPTIVDLQAETESYLSLEDLNDAIEGFTYKGCELFVESGEIKPALNWQRIKEALKSNWKQAEELPIEERGSPVNRWIVNEKERDFQQSLDGKVLGTLVEGPKHHLCPDCGTDLTIVSRSEIPEDVRIATSKKGEGVPKRSRPEPTSIPGPGVTRQ